MATELAYYVLNPEDYTKLQDINKALYGDGSILTGDARRDLANKMNLILNTCFIPFHQALDE